MQSCNVVLAKYEQAHKSHATVREEAQEGSKVVTIQKSSSHLISAILATGMRTIDSTIVLAVSLEEAYHEFVLLVINIISKTSFMMDLLYVPEKVCKGCVFPCPARRFTTRNPSKRFPRHKVLGLEAMP